MTIEEAITTLNAMRKCYGENLPIFMLDPNEDGVIREDVNIYAYECDSEEEMREYGSQYYVTFEL